MTSKPATSSSSNAVVGARRSHAARPSQRARTAAATGGASEHDSGALPARESYLILSRLG
jgi:hypothetical protein